MDGPQARRAQPGWSVKQTFGLPQTGSRRDKIPAKPPPLVVVRDFEVCHSHPGNRGKRQRFGMIVTMCIEIAHRRRLPPRR
jgi:hypothetical protein